MSILNLEYNKPLNLQVKDEIHNGEIFFASDNILQDIFDGYLKPEEILINNDDIQTVKRAIHVIEEYIHVLDKHIEEM